MPVVTQASVLERDNMPTYYVRSGELNPLKVEADDAQVAFLRAVQIAGQMIPPAKLGAIMSCGLTKRATAKTLYASTEGLMAEVEYDTKNNPSNNDTI